MRRSKGFRSQTRHKLRKKVRERGTLAVSKVIKTFSEGDTVHIVLDPSVQKGQPHPRFHGRTGRVLEQRGRSYLVEVRDGKALKKVIAAPVHLRLQGTGK
jgi:large subunit ribosomal protein L21e